MWAICHSTFPRESQGRIDTNNYCFNYSGSSWWNEDFSVCIAWDWWARMNDRMHIKCLHIMFFYCVPGYFPLCLGLCNTKWHNKRVLHWKICCWGLLQGLLNHPSLSHLTLCIFSHCSLFLFTEESQRKSQSAEHLAQKQKLSGDFKLSRLQTISPSSVTMLRNLLLCKLVLCVNICRLRGTETFDSVNSRKSHGKTRTCSRLVTCSRLGISTVYLICAIPRWKCRFVL